MKQAFENASGAEGVWVCGACADRFSRACARGCRIVTREEWGVVILDPGNDE